MGFAQSGAFAILVIASLMVVGMVYPAVSNASEQVAEARDEMETLETRQENTALLKMEDGDTITP